MEGFISTYGLYFTYILVAVCALAILFFAIARIVSHPEAAKSFLIGLVALVVLGGVSYGLSSGADAETIYKKLEVTKGTSHGVGAGLVTFYLLMGIAVLSIIYVEITRLFKKNG